MIPVLLLSILVLVVMAGLETSDGTNRRKPPDVADSNWKGIPIDGLSLKDVQRRVIRLPSKQEVVPMYCPICLRALHDYKSAFNVTLQDFEVRGKFCEQEHWTYLTWKWESE